MSVRVRPRSILIALFGATAVLLVVWAMAVPVFEAPDEPAHWQYARYLHDEGRLPLYRAGFEEANSPPLYYSVIAPLAVESRLPPSLKADGLATWPSSLAAPRLFLNSDRDFEWYQPILRARLLTVGISLITVWICYVMGARIGGWPTGLIAAACVALLPQFSFRAGSISNDAMVTMFAAATTLSTIQLVRDGFTWGRGIWAAIMLAGAYLSKISAIALAAPLALAILASPGPLWMRIRRLSVLLVAAAIVLPWSARNVMLYGDPFASNAMRDAVSYLITDRSLLSPYFLQQFPKDLFKSFVGVFGWFTVDLPRWGYVGFILFGLIALVGLARGLWRRTIDWRLAGVLAVTFAAVLAVVVHINLSFTQPQGRYMFPALPAIALLMALGITHLPAFLASRAHITVPAGLAAFNVYALCFVLIPAFYPPLARDVAPGIRVLYPSELSGMRLATAAPTFRIDDLDAGWTVPVDVNADSFDTLELELASKLPGAPVVRGAVTFGADAASLEDAAGADRRITFEWRADGGHQLVRIPLAQHRAWQRHIGVLRIEPIDGGAVDPRHQQIALGPIHLFAEPTTRVGAAASQR